MTAPGEERVVTSDGFGLAARFYRPQGESRGAVLIVPAMGVSQNYYAPLALWLAERGYLAASFDYRGMGLSRRGGLRGFKADILDWARLDCSAMVEAIAARTPGVPLNWVGHSLGGQILPFVPNLDKVARAITIATGSGYWRENATPLKRRVWWLWYFVAPLCTALYGYFPGRRLGMVGDLPRGVIEQWRRWCLDPEYAVGAEGEAVRAQFAAVRTPIVSLSFVDDELMSEKNIASIHGFYTGSDRTMRRISPGDIGAQRIGHFGFFRPEYAESLWQLQLLPQLSPA